MNYEDYATFTTFWSDFSIAERFGYEAIDDTAARAYKEWKNDVKYLTELVMILNHKCWMYYHDGAEALSDHYSDLYYKYYEKALNYLDKKGNKEDISYFIRTLD